MPVFCSGCYKKWEQIKRAGVKSLGIHLWAVLEAASFQVLCPELEHARTDGKILALHWQNCFLRNLMVMNSNFCINFLASFWSFSIWIFYTDATFLQDTTGYISSFESLQPGLVWQPDAKSIFLSLAPLWYFGRMGDILGLNKIWASIKTWWNTLNLHPLAITSWGNLK